MPHQCTKCGEIFPDAAGELLKGCSCGSRFFYYIRQERLEQLENDYKETIVELEKADKEQIEKDIRELTGMTDEPDKPVILDLESIKVLGPGKFEIDLVNLFSKERPIIYKLEEGKYIIDLASSLKVEGRKTNKNLDRIFPNIPEDSEEEPEKENEKDLEETQENIYQDSDEEIIEKVMKKK